MKKILLLFLSIFSSLVFANNLSNVYHKNYGIIDRTVLVFEKSPDYSIIKQDKKIKVILQDCNKAVSIENTQIPGNLVLESFDFKKENSNLVFTISTDSIYILKYFSLKEKKKFKLVLDIFLKKEPEAIEDFLSYANFYQTVGYQKKGEKYLEIAENLKTQKTKEDSLKNNQKQIDLERMIEGQKRNEKQRKIIKAYKIQMVFLGFSVLIGLVLLILAFPKKKKSKLDTNEQNYRSTEGFGSFEFRKKMVRKLTEHKWESEEIARELNLTNDEVKRLQREIMR